MKRLPFFFFLLCLLSSCALFEPPLELGASEQEVLSRYGEPSNIYEDGENSLWEYAGGYWSQKTYMAKMDKNKKLIAWEQVKTDAQFAKIQIGKTTAKEVLKLVGKPTETSQIHLNNYIVWSYRYLQDDVWNGMMHVMFDDNGVVQKIEAGRDPIDDDRGFFGSRFGLGGARIRGFGGNRGIQGAGISIGF